MENYAKYGEAIYFHNHQDFLVNLFISSTLDWQEKGLKPERSVMKRRLPLTTIGGSLTSKTCIPASPEARNAYLLA